LSALILELRHYRCNITAIQETKWAGQQVFECQRFTVFSSGGSKGSFGTGFIVDPKWAKHVVDWRPINERICVLRVKGKFFNYSIVNVHAPHNERPEDEKDAFYRQLDKVYEECPQNDIKIVIGDLNAQIGREKIFKPTIGGFSLHSESNENGVRLINFAASWNMVISSTFFRHKDIHKATWLSPGGRNSNQIDHVLIDRRHASNILDVRSFRCLESDIEHHSSDHFLLGAKIRARISNINKERGVKCKRYDVAKLSNKACKDAFDKELKERLNVHQEETAWNHCCEAMQASAEKCLGFKQHTKNVWFDSECEEAVQRVIDARKGRITRAKADEIRKLQKEKKKILQRKKREHDLKVISEVQEAHSMNESRKFYKAINTTKKSFHARVSVCKRKDGSLVCDKEGVLDRWKEHFDELLNTGADEIVSQDRRPYETDDGKVFEPPSLDEVVTAIGGLKNNKAPGLDGLPAELFKTGCDELHAKLHQLIVRVWTEEKLPDEWMIGLICPIHKKGCKMTCTNYRGISLLPSAYKVLSKILSSRLEPYAEAFVSEYQAGFRRQRSTSDQMFSIRQIVQKSYEMNVETLHLFIDFRAAYDSIDREGLWNIMAESRFPHKLIRLLKATLARVMCSVKVQGTTSGMFECKIGLRQGDELSTKLFNIALEGVFRRAKLELNGTIFTKSIQLLGFADDVDIVGRNIRSVTDAYSRMEREANKIGLRVNEDKTKFLMVAASARTKSFVGSHLVIGDKRFEVVNDFVYLGSIISNNFDTSIEIKRRILAAQRAFFSIRHLLTSKRISRRAKLEMYKTLIRPVVMYGSESWNMTVADEQAIGVFERKVLRTIFGPRKEGDLFKCRSNAEVYQLFREADIIKRIKVNRLRWAGHVVRRPVEAPLLKVFKSDFVDGKRSRGRPKNSWKEAVDKDSIAFGIGNWQAVASDRASYRRQLREVMDHN
jgi:hypothetical protein